MKPLVMEIVGPSGAGKSTLSKLLRAEDKSLTTGISVWGLPYAGLAFSAMKLMPSILRMNFCKKEYEQMIRLDALNGRLDSLAKSNDSKALLLDEGPVFAMSKMRVNRDKHGPAYESWEESSIDKWSQMLDGVIMLDAPDEILIERIRSRAKQHRMKEKSSEEIAVFLSRYRDAFDKTLGGLKRRKNLGVLKFDTSLDSLESIAQEIARVCEVYRSPINEGVSGKDREYVYERTC